MSHLPDDFSTAAFDARWGGGQTTAEWLREEALRETKRWYRLSAVGTVGVTAYLEIATHLRDLVKTIRGAGAVVDEAWIRDTEVTLWDAAGAYDTPRELFEAADEALDEFAEGVIADNWPAETTYRRPRKCGHFLTNPAVFQAVGRV